jgi:hypothetical protein
VRERERKREREEWLARPGVLEDCLHVKCRNGFFFEPFGLGDDASLSDFPP